MKADSLGDRMKKNYENITRYKLTRRTPVIIRLDGKAFHTLTRRCNKPFDQEFIESMVCATHDLFDLIGGNLKFAYVQSDEVSLLLTDYDKLTTEAYFDYNIQKLCSIVASKMSMRFSYYFNAEALFDARCFNIPKEEVCNYFIWRQQDWERNSIQMLAQSLYSHKQLQNKNHGDLHEMIYAKDQNWSKLATQLKLGTCISKTPEGPVIDRYFAQFKEDRNYIEQHLEVEDA